jgi:hypothetical protein
VGAFLYRAVLRPRDPEVDGTYFQVTGEFLHAHATAPLEFANGTWWVLALVASLVFPVVCVVLVDAVGSAFRSFRASSQESDDSTLPLALLALCLALHIALTSSFITFYNNYFLPLVVMAHVLIAGALRPEKEQPTAPAFALLAVTAIASLLVIDAHFRYVEANQRALDKVIAAGADPMDVYSYGSSFAWANYDAVSDHIVKSRNITYVFRYFRNFTHYRIQDSALKAPGRAWRIIEKEPYRTLAGESSVSVWTSVRAQSRRTPATPNATARTQYLP